MTRRLHNWLIESVCNNWTETTGQLSGCPSVDMWILLWARLLWPTIVGKWQRRKTQNTKTAVPGLARRTRSKAVQTSQQTTKCWTNQSMTQLKATTSPKCEEPSGDDWAARHTEKITSVLLTYVIKYILWIFKIITYFKKKKWDKIDAIQFGFLLNIQNCIKSRHRNIFY